MPHAPQNSPRPNGLVTGAGRLTPGGIEVVFNVPVPPAPGPRTDAAREAAGGAPPPALAAPNFSGVSWGGVVFSFNFKQRMVVAALIEARRLGHPFVAQETLLSAAESDGGPLRDLFGRHPAWGTMIVPALSVGGPLGSYALADPPA